MKNKLCVNFFGGPGCGKTTAAAEIFLQLKKHNIDVEIVSEFAKDLILEGKETALKHQWFVLANQSYRIQCAYEKMQIVLVDSPILLGPIYDPDSSPALLALCLEHYDKYNNLNIIMDRNLEYKHTSAGRIHSLTESISLDNRINRFLDDYNIPYLKYKEYTPDRIVNIILHSITAA